MAPPYATHSRRQGPNLRGLRRADRPPQPPPDPARTSMTFRKPSRRASSWRYSGSRRKCRPYRERALARLGRSRPPSRVAGPPRLRRTIRIRRASRKREQEAWDSSANPSSAASPCPPRKVGTQTLPHTASVTPVPRGRVGGDIGGRWNNHRLDCDFRYCITPDQKTTIARIMRVKYDESMDDMPIYIIK